MSWNWLFAGGLQRSDLTAQLVDIKYEGTPCQKVCITVQLKAHAFKEALRTVVKVDFHCIHVCVETGTPVAIPLNVYVRPETCQCNLQGEMLKVELDYMPVEDVIQAAKDQKPFEFGAVDLKSHGVLHELD